MKRIFSLTMITIVLIILIAGCGGGGAGTGIVPGPQPSPTDPPPTIVPTTGTLQFYSDLVDGSFELYKIVNGQVYNYLRIQGGTDQLYAPDFVVDNRTADTQGSFEAQLDPGSYIIIQSVTNRDETVRYWLGEVTIAQGVIEPFDLRGEDLAVVNCDIRFKYPTTFGEVNDSPRIVGYLTDISNSKISTVFSFLRDNYNIKEWKIKFKLPKSTYVLNLESVDKNGHKNQINDEYNWDLSSTSIFDEKIEIGDITPDAAGEIYSIDHENILKGDGLNNDGVYVSTIKDTGDNQFLVGTYDPNGLTTFDQIVFLEDCQFGKYYVVSFKIKYTGNDYTANKLAIVEVKGTGDKWYYCDILGTYFKPVQNEPALTEIIIQLLVAGPLEKIGFKATAYQGIVGIGAGTVTIYPAGNFQSRPVPVFPAIKNIEETKTMFRF